MSQDTVTTQYTEHVSVDDAGTLRQYFRVEAQIRLLKVTRKGITVVTSHGVASVGYQKQLAPGAGPYRAQPALTDCEGLKGSIITAASWGVNDYGAPQYDRVGHYLESLHSHPCFPLYILEQARGDIKEGCYCRCMHSIIMHSLQVGTL